MMVMSIIEIIPLRHPGRDDIPDRVRDDADRRYMTRRDNRQYHQGEGTSLTGMAAA